MFKDDLKKARLRAGLSGRETSKKAGISSAYYSQLETGARNRPPPDVLARLEGVLQTKFAGMASPAELPLESEADPKTESRLSQFPFLLTARERCAQYATIAYDSAVARSKAGPFETFIQHVAGVLSSDDEYDWHRREMDNILNEHFPKSEVEPKG